MDFVTKQLLKNGFGSPGETALTFCNRLNYFEIEDEFSEKWKFYFRLLIDERLIIASKVGNDGCLYNLEYLIKEVIPYSESSLSALVLMMMIFETENFRKNAFTSQDVFNDVVEVIFETVQENTPFANNLPIEHVKLKGLELFKIVKDSAKKA